MKNVVERPKARESRMAALRGEYSSALASVNRKIMTVTVGERAQVLAEIAAEYAALADGNP